MMLTADELKWIDTRMEIYDIKYQEIYDEILDHVITAIEEKRKAGDRQDIKWLFQEVVDKHFEGYFGVEKLVTEQENVYKRGIKKIWLQTFRHFLNWPMLAFIVIALLLSFKLPNVKMVQISLMIGCLLLAFSPVLSTYFLLAGKFKTVKGKKSILKTQIVTRAAMPASLLNAIIYLPQLFVLWNGKADNWSIFKNMPPPVSMTLVLFFMVLNLTVMRFCREAMSTKVLA